LIRIVLSCFGRRRPASFQSAAEYVVGDFDRLPVSCQPPTKPG